MALKIRLARGGAKKRPFYRIVVAEASAPRDGDLSNGWARIIRCSRPSIMSEWCLIKSAHNTGCPKVPSRPLRVHKMMTALGLLAAPEIREQPKKSALGKKRLEREADGSSHADRDTAAAAPADAPAAASPADPAEEAASGAQLLRKHLRKKPLRKKPLRKKPLRKNPARNPCGSTQRSHRRRICGRIGAWRQQNRVTYGATTDCCWCDYRASGIRGAVKIKPFTARPEGVVAYGAVYDESGRTYDIRIERQATRAVNLPC